MKKIMYIMILTCSMIMFTSFVEAKTTNANVEGVILPSSDIIDKSENVPGTVLPLTDKEYCEKNGGYYYTNNGSGNISTGCYELNGPNCSAFGFYWMNNRCDTSKKTIEGWRFLREGASADPNITYPCGQRFFVDYCDVDGEYCYGNVNSGTVKIYRSKITNSQNVAKENCSTTTTNEPDKKEEQVVDDECSLSDNKKVTGKNGSGTYKVCYNANSTDDEILEIISSKYRCDKNNGYYLDEENIEEVVHKCNGNFCSAVYNVSCTKGSKSKPVVTVISGVAKSNGEGIITVKASSVDGKIKEYYVSQTYETPTESSSWISTDSDTFTISGTAGTWFIWVKDSNEIVSNPVSGSVIDTVNTNTTIGKLELYDENGNIQSMSKIGVNDADFVPSKYALMSNKLIADGFNPFDMQYKIEAKSPTITVYATLTSSDSKYVEGYEPRTVNLKFGMNTILIKIQNKDGVIRTYTILVNRTDDRSSDNTLNELSVDKGEINFNSNITEYKVMIPKDTNKVNVKSVIGSNLAKYVSGYEPGEVSINSEVTNKLIKVMSQTGSVRTYVITFIKEGNDVINKESLQLNSLVIPKAYLPFESDIANYNVSVEYERDYIDLKLRTKNENSKYFIRYKNGNGELRNGSDIGIPLTVGDNLVEIMILDEDNEYSIYRVNIIRKEMGLDISNDSTLKELKVLGYDIKFNPNDKNYTVKIKQEKSLVITAIPNSNRSEVFIRGNDELTGFSTVRVKVVAENGNYDTYSIDIKKDAFNKTIEIASIVVGGVIILVSSCIIVIKKKARKNREYFEE